MGIPEETPEEMPGGISEEFSVRNSWRLQIGGGFSGGNL